MALFKYDSTNDKLVPLTSEGSIGLPIGAVMAFASGTTNENWLLCDGRDTTGTVEELQTHYPALYTYLGNSNILPDYRECVLVGVGQNTTDTIAAHDVYTLGEFKDDQFQGHAHDRGAVSGSDNTNGGAYRTIPGVIPTGGPTTYDTYGTPRFGTTTHGKQKGVAFYIKATSAGIEVDKDLYATKGYVSGWTDITSDWALIYVQSGSPTLEKVLWRPSTQELKLVVNATGISVSGNSTWSITARYDGTDQTIVGMKNNPFYHAASIMPTNTVGTYRLMFVPDSISFSATDPEFYATVRNVSSNAGQLEHIVYHITL